VRPEPNAISNAPGKGPSENHGAIFRSRDGQDHVGRDLAERIKGHVHPLVVRIVHDNEDHSMVDRS
jgi:hypothetical protein